MCPCHLNVSRADLFQVVPISLDNYLFAFSPWILSRSQTSRSEREQLVLLQTCSQFNLDSIPESAMQGQAQISQVLLCPHPGSQPITKTHGFCARCAAEPPLPFALLRSSSQLTFSLPPQTHAITSLSVSLRPLPLLIMELPKSNHREFLSIKISSWHYWRASGFHLLWKENQGYGIYVCVNNWTTVLYSRY